MPAWLAHDDDNKVEVLYAGDYDSEMAQTKEIAKFIRRGLTVREIVSDDARHAWGKTLSEVEMRKIAAAPVYDPSEAGALHCAAAVVAAASKATRLEDNGV